jgi:hypothetical protein
MAITPTRILGVSQIGDHYEATYKVSLDSSSLVTGELLDLTDDFSEIMSAKEAGVTVIGAAGYKFTVLLPADGTAITASNVKLVASAVPALDGGTAAAQAFAASDGVDMSTFVEVRIEVKGKAIGNAS